MEKRSACNTFITVGVFSIAMGFLEAVVVVYLRKLYYPEGFSFPLSTIPVTILLIELVRESTTLVMLVCVAVLAGNNYLQWFAYFIYTFGVWDIFYYVGLKLMVNWPESLLTWDILFLIPVAWVGPVLAPVICSLTMIALAGCIVFFQEKGYTIIMKKTEWALLLFGAFVIFCTFIRDYSVLIIRKGFLTEISAININERFLKVLAEYIPTRFNWFSFSVGEAFIIGSMGLLIWKTMANKGSKNVSG